MDRVFIELELRNDLAKALTDSAARYRVAPVEHLADIIEAVLGDNLIDAVLDP